MLHTNRLVSVLCPVAMGFHALTILHGENTLSDVAVGHEIIGCTSLSDVRERERERPVAVERRGR